MTAAFEVEKGVPIPKQRARREGGTKYPFAEMEVGDSFAVGFVSEKVLTAIRQASVRFVKERHPDRKFSFRKLEDGSYRCWRVA
jgi:hypothetical protein